MKRRVQLVPLSSGVRSAKETRKSGALHSGQSSDGVFGAPVTSTGNSLSEPPAFLISRLAGFFISGTTLSHQSRTIADVMPIFATFIQSARGS
jgi:hypothetical protein